jgi:hypothetical protein
MVLAALTLRAAPPRIHTGVDRDAGPDVTFNENKIAVSGASKGDVLYAAGLEIRGVNGDVRLESRAATGVVASDGTAALDMQQSITVRSIWVVVDGKGGYTVTPGPGMVRRMLGLQGNGLVSGSDGQVKQLAVKRSSVYVYLVRPKVGIWGTRFIDGAPNDDDKHKDGGVNGSLQNLAPLAGTTVPAPERLSPGDVLFIVDPITLEYAVSRKGK